MYDEWDDEPFHRRLVVRAGRLAQRMTARSWARLVCWLLAAYLTYCALSYALGATVVDQSAVHASDHFAEDPRNASHYRWHGDVADAAIGEHVVEARAKIAASQLLALMAADSLDSPATLVRCRDFVTGASSERLAAMVAAAQHLLQANRDMRCACGPQLGYQVRYLAMAQQTPPANSTAKLREAAASDHHNNTASIAFGDDRHVVVHMFNPVDEHQREYDSLDADFFAAQAIDFHVADEQQNYRYNEQRGQYAVVRRTHLRVAGIDQECHRERITLTGTLALCAEQCMDLLRGIDVRQRALLQSRSGVTLNSEQLHRWQQTQQTTTADRSEL